MLRSTDLQCLPALQALEQEEQKETNVEEEEEEEYIEGDEEEEEDEDDDDEEEVRPYALLCALSVMPSSLLPANNKVSYPSIDMCYTRG